MADSTQTQCTPSREITFSKTNHKDKMVLVICIPKELAQGELKFRSPSRFTLTATFNKPATRDLKWTFTCAYQKPGQRYIDLQGNRTLHFSDKDITGSISISPKYLLGKRTYKKVHKSQQYHNIPVITHQRVSKKADSLTTIYTHNNLFRPYSGGLVTPK